MLPARSSERIHVLDLSASDNLITPLLRILLSVLSQYELNHYVCYCSDVRDVFDLSASDNAVAPSGPMKLTVLSENQMKQQVITSKIK
jgi:hypothetical protein